MMDQRRTRHSCRCESKAKITRPRHLHQSTIHLGDVAPCYTTTHHQSFSGRSSDGRPVLFYLRDPSFPSQHRAHLDLSDSPDPPQTHLQSHSEEAHGPKRVTARTDPKKENWARYHSGQAVREITHSQDPPEDWTSHRTEPTVSPQLAGGRPTQWHHHNILTGERRQTSGPGSPSRRSRDRLLWTARRWETDGCSLRLY